MLMRKKRESFVPVNRKFFLLLLLLLSSVGLLVWWLAWRWHPNYVPEEARSAYPVSGHQSDTLLVAFIGDSWADLHSSFLPDSVVSEIWTSQIGRPVRFVSCGKGGANSGDVYRFMFHQNLPIDTLSSMSLLQQRPDYCVVTVGINDVLQNVGKFFFCKNYQLIIRHLLRCGIRPVVIEMPDVDINNVRGGFSLKETLGNAYKMIMTGESSYNVAEYRLALKDDLGKSGMMDSVVYISRHLWNPNGYHDSLLYQDDRVHLSPRGYLHLDSCVKSVIHHDDTLRVAVVGDSWALFHGEYGCDTLLDHFFEKQYSKHVRCYSKGKAGITSKDLYENLSLECHPNYCVIMIGINDLCYQTPPDRYVEYYQLIIQNLLNNRICPIVMEIPEFDIASACRYMGLRRYLKSRFLSFFTGAGWDNTDNYRRGLKKMLYQSGLMDHVIYIPESYWNSTEGRNNMFTDDGFHLTQEGYYVLDSCLASEIVSYHSIAFPLMNPSQ